MIEEFNNLNLPENHYLRIAKEAKSNYFDEFIQSISKVKDFLSPKDFKILWEDKMQFNKQKFDEKAFIQSACELAVATYFCEKSDFNVEVKVNPESKKDVDVQFKSNGFTYNIEVKCASFDAKEKVQNSDSFKYGTHGRINGRNDLINIISSSIDEGSIINGESLKPHLELKNMDNNLKDFLVSAHEKFNPKAGENELNILLVGCNDAADMQSWVGYLTAPQGLFTASSFENPANYENVDLVVFTNLYFKHKDFHKKKISNSWNLDQTLNLGIINPFSKQNKIKGILNFNTELINYNNEINKFKVSGDVPDFVKEIVRIPHFVHEFLERDNKIYLFETNINNNFNT